jgi:hypothetical protein
MKGRRFAFVLARSRRTFSSCGPVLPVLKICVPGGRFNATTEPVGFPVERGVPIRPRPPLAGAPKGTRRGGGRELPPRRIVLHVVRPYPTVVEVPAHLPDHDLAEGDPEDYQRGDVHRGEEPPQERVPRSAAEPTALGRYRIRKPGRHHAPTDVRRLEREGLGSRSNQTRLRVAPQGRERQYAGAQEKQAGDGP